MKDRQASATALLIAASLVSMERNPAYAGTISTASAQLATRILETYSPTSRYFLKLLRRSWFWQVAAVCERLTIPGVLRHYALRKKCIAQLVCEAAAEGISQIVVLGAGFDGLGIELHVSLPIYKFGKSIIRRHNVGRLPLLIQRKPTASILFPPICLWQG